MSQKSNIFTRPSPFCKGICWGFSGKTVFNIVSNSQASLLKRVCFKDEASMMQVLKALFRFYHPLRKKSGNRKKKCFKHKQDIVISKRRNKKKINKNQITKIES